ncbi:MULTISPECIES: dimethylarginine dimethylaminohydrolase family protein [Kordiimonas]|jgi:N-dimethylarginine dimethylaminohydrolase|uniref:dimethylarginine dimethylaminohydrolase family protein n=1 Tax=Kordiimonas TaxID=288021 RepID=UPI00257A653F|nr:arginine deiminase family protein [Kordiimonas sp. UBA4487]
MKTLSGLNEYGALKVVAVRPPEHAYVSDEKVADEWERLRFYSAPKLGSAIDEHKIFTDKLRASGAEVIMLGGDDALTLDSIYARDAVLVSPKGLILCHMGRAGRRGEPAVNASAFEAAGYPVLGTIEAPGTIEGGDIIWLDDHALAVGEGPRTNAEGIRQLQGLLGPDVEVHTVPLPPPSHPEDVFHLMSMISPLDHDLALIYRPLMPDSFINWLEARGIGFVEVPEEEFIPMGCNVLALGPRNILMLDRLPETKARLEAAGCTVDTYKGDEISRKGEGGPTCLTRPLVRGT